MVKQIFTNFHEFHFKKWRYVTLHPTSNFDVPRYIGGAEYDCVKWPKWDRYEWDAMCTAETDMIEKLEPEFAE